MRRCFLAGMFLLIVSALFAQDIRITRRPDRTYPDQYMAKLEFVSNSDKLEFFENTGEMMSAPVKKGGKFVYEAIIDVADGGSRSFQIWQKGSVEKTELNLELMEQTWVSFEIEVTELPLVIQNVKTTASHVPHAQAAKALVSVICNHAALDVQILANGVLAENAVLDAPQPKPDGSYEYLATVDLSSLTAQGASYSLKLMVGSSEPVIYEIGNLAQKDGVEVAVVVVQESSCFQHNMGVAENAYVNGLYRDAYFAYKDALECDDVETPQIVKKKMKNSAILQNAKEKVMKDVEKAENYRKEHRLDSCMVYYQEAHKFSTAILKMNPNDSYCMRFNRDFPKLAEGLPRMVSGKVVDAARLDMNMQSMPLANVYVVLYKHEKERKKVKGIVVDEPGKVVDQQTLCKTDASGRFNVMVPRDDSMYMYMLYFVFDKEETGLSNVPDISYRPTDADVQRNVIVRFISKRINRN